MSKKEVELPDPENDNTPVNDSDTQKSEPHHDGDSDTESAAEAGEEGQSPEELLAQEKEKFLRLFAEFENYKKRTSRERVEYFKTAGQEVIQSLLPVLDDFDRALAGMKSAEADQWLEGVELISQKLREVLRQKGLEPVEVNKGDAFDSEIHEAVTQIPAPEKKLKGKIVDVIETGYRLGDKIIRHPKVVVGQ